MSLWLKSDTKPQHKYTGTRSESMLLFQVAVRFIFETKSPKNGVPLLNLWLTSLSKSLFLFVPHHSFPKIDVYKRKGGIETKPDPMDIPGTSPLCPILLLVK